MSAVRIASAEALPLGRIEDRADRNQVVLVGHGELVSNATVARSIVEASRSALFRLGLGVRLVGADPLDRWLDDEFVIAGPSATCYPFAGVDPYAFRAIGDAHANLGRDSVSL